MIEIVNLRNNKLKYKYDFRCDRESPLGNPYNLKSEEFRNDVCDKYETWFYQQIENKNLEVIDYINELRESYNKYGKLRLFCWCTPKRCHVETIKKYLEKELLNESNC